MNILRTVKKQLAGKETKRKYHFFLVVTLFFSVLVEALVFNYKAVHSAFDEPIKISGYTVENASKISEKEFLSAGGENTITITGINSKVKYLNINIVVPNNDTLTITIGAKDEANENWLNAPARIISEKITRSNYIRLHYSGNIKDLRIGFHVGKDETYTINSLGLNAKVPFMFSMGRMLFVWIFMMLMVFLRPNSFIYKIKLDLHSNIQRAIIIFLIIGIVTGFFPLSKMDPWCDRTVVENTQYQDLAKAIRKGSVVISEEKNPDMLALENPYDTKQRGSLGRFDTAYYNGKYYVYFGIAPVLLYYLPYNLITNQNLNNSTAVYISSVLAAVGILFMLWQLAKKWFKNMSFGIYFITALISIIGGGIIYTVKRPDLYPVPIITASMLSTYGLGFWLGARTINKKGQVILKKSYLALGSFCMAAVASSRPQMLLASALAFAIFYNEVMKERLLFSKKSIKETICVCIPYIIIAVLVMQYNFIRFESPFDFGASYNLTSNDMTKRGFNIGRIGLGLFSYLFQTPHTKAVFPFLETIKPLSVYQGLTVSEHFFGGVMMTEPLLWFGIIALFMRKSFKDKRLYFMVLLSFSISIVIIILDTQMAGLLRRYFGDFLWIMYFGAAIACFCLYEYMVERAGFVWECKLVSTLVLFLSLAIVFHGLEIFVDAGGWGIVNTNKILYYKLQYLIAFWM